VLTVLIPCRNEAGNVEAIFKGIQELKDVREFIIIEGNSTDRTYEELLNSLNASEDSRIRVIKQTGQGKFNAVLEGAQQSSSAHLAIWDGDMTIDFNDQNNLIELYLHAAPEHQKRFVTANRLNPQINDSAMRPLNKLGNHLFAKLTKHVASIDIPDALAGSKIFPKFILEREEVCQVSMNLDPFGDLFLLAQIRKYDLKFISINCEYKSRTYGSTNINRWSGGFAMLKFLTHIKFHACNRPSETTNSK
jgi:glycosyltransferase involved in cell wall biosynthesis